MQQNNFHKLYVAPVIVAILTTIIGGIGTYYFSQPPLPPYSPILPVHSAEASPANEVIELPKDTATQSIVQEFIKDPAAASAKYQGKEVQLCSVIALIEPSGVLELYGATSKNHVEGLYFKCSLQKKDGVIALERNQLVTLKGKVAGYFHHRKSPRIMLKACHLLQP